MSRMTDRQKGTDRRIASLLHLLPLWSGVGEAERVSGNQSLRWEWTYLRVNDVRGKILQEDDFVWKQMAELGR